MLLAEAVILLLASVLLKLWPARLTTGGHGESSEFNVVKQSLRAQIQAFNVQLCLRRREFILRVTKICPRLLSKRDPIGKSFLISNTNSRAH